MGESVGEAISETEDFFFSVFEEFEGLVDGMSHVGAVVVERGVAVVSDDVLEGGIVAVSEWCFEGQGVMGGFSEGGDALGVEAYFFGDFVVGGVSSELLVEGGGGAGDSGDGFGDVDGDANGAALVADGAADGLFDPPGGIGTEAVAFSEVEFPDGAHESDVAFLDQVGQGEPAAGVLFGDGHDEAEVSFDQPLPAPEASGRGGAREF